MTLTIPPRPAAPPATSGPTAHVAASGPAAPAAGPRTGHARRGPALLALAVLLAHAVYALREHARFGTTGYDLGIFTQAVRGWAEDQRPASAIRAATAPPGFTGEEYPLLGDHFHPVLAVLAPVWRLAPYAETLLVAQAVLVAASAYVVARAAQRHLPTAWAWPALGLAYGFSWGLQQLTGFDFHEVAFALPFLALAGRAYLDGRWPAAAWWASGLLLVKEDLGVTAAVLGFLLLRRHRRAGLALGIGALAATALVVLVLIPAVAPEGRYGYLAQAPTPTYGLLDGWPRKTLTLTALLAVTGGLLPRSPLALLLVPTLAWRLFSPNPSYWGTDLHYSAVLMPIAFLALVDALRHSTRRSSPALLASLLAAALLFPFQPLRDLVTPGFWQDDPRRSAARAALALVPANAQVAASNHLAPHLADRATVRLATPDVFVRHPEVTWIVAAVDDPFPAGAARATVRDARARGWRTVWFRDGVVVLLRPVGGQGAEESSVPRRRMSRVAQWKEPPKGA
ncbi:DUF2079 domain-containing protein [Streptomyces sp. NPDC126499]|uniref:DUF2079 domain-containing protein n=1 Tax=Streptomyces sp. NPDC126499 TaxID=3155314 RepID=UPI00331EF8BC